MHTTTKNPGTGSAWVSSTTALGTSSVHSRFTTCSAKSIHSVERPILAASRRASLGRSSFFFFAVDACSWQHTLRSCTGDVMRLQRHCYTPKTSSMHAKHTIIRMQTMFTDTLPQSIICPWCSIYTLKIHLQFHDLPFAHCRSWALINPDTWSNRCLNSTHWKSCQCQSLQMNWSSAARIAHLLLSLQPRKTKALNAVCDKDRQCQGWPAQQQREVAAGHQPF